MKMFLCENSEVIQVNYADSDSSCSTMLKRIHYGGVCAQNEPKDYLKISCSGGDIKEYMKLEMYPTQDCSGLADDRMLVAVGCTLNSDYDSMSQSWTAKSRIGTLQVSG